jgi:hypothetical protein
LYASFADVLFVIVTIPPLEVTDNPTEYDVPTNFCATSAEQYHNSNPAHEYGTLNNKKPLQSIGTVAHVSTYL